MKELFDSLWKVAPRLMSVVVILSIIYYAALQVAQLQTRLDTIDKRLTALEEKVDLIIEYILRK